MFGNGESTVLYKYILVPGDFSFVQEGKVLLEIYLRTLHISKYMTVESVLHAAELRLRGNFECGDYPSQTVCDATPLSSAVSSLC